MNSPTFNYSISCSSNNQPYWFINFTFTDTLHREINLAGYLATAQEGARLVLPDKTTVTRIGTTRLTRTNKIVKITHNPNQKNFVMRVSTQLSMLDRHEFGQIMLSLESFGANRKFSSELVQDIRNLVIRHQCDGGVIDVGVSKVTSKVFKRSEDSALDRMVETWLQRYFSEQKLPADNSLKTIRYSRGCVICMEDFEDGSKITTLPCDHMFHGGCIAEWLQIKHKCPLCRTQISH